MNFFNNGLAAFLLVSAAAVPAAADTSRFTWHPFPGATVTPVAHASTDGYMAGGRFHYAGASEVGGHPLYYTLSLTATTGRLQAGETQLGGRTGDVFGFGRSITVTDVATATASFRYPYHPHRQWLGEASVSWYHFRVKEDFYLFDAVKGDTDERWLPSWYVSLGHQWYLADQNAFLTATVRWSEGVDTNDLPFPISTGSYENLGREVRIAFDYGQTTDWGSWGWHVAASHDRTGWSPELGIRATNDLGVMSIGPVEFNVSGFVSGEVIKYDDYTDKAARLGVVLDHASGLSATVGASWNQDDKWQGIVGVEMRF